MIVATHGIIHVDNRRKPLHIPLLGGVLNIGVKHITAVPIIDQYQNVKW